MNRIPGTFDVQQPFFQMDAEATPVTPAELERYVRGEIAKCAKTVKELGINGD